MRRAGIYLRVSTDEQAREGVSLEVQEADTRAWCEAHGIDQITVYADEGISGRTMRRPGLQALLEDLEHLDVVVVWRVDRLSRDNTDRGLIRRTFEQRNVEFVSVTQPTAGGSSPEDRLTDQILGAMAEFESMQIGARVRAAHRKLAADGKPTTGPPFGYHADWTVNEAQAVVIRRIDRDYLDGIGYKAITMRLNADQVPSPRGGEWSPSVVLSILERPTYSGLLRWGKKPNRSGRRVNVDDSETMIVEAPSIPVIRSEDTYRQIMDARAARRTDEHGPRITKFGGLIVCGLCGSRMQASNASYKTVKGVRRSYRYYVCGRSRDRGLCQSNNLSELHLEATIRTELEAGPTMTASPSKPDLVQSLESELEDVALRRSRILAGFEAGAISLDEMTERLDLLNKRRERLEVRVKEAEQGPVEFSTDQLDPYPGDADPDAVRAWATKSIRRITWTKATETLLIDWRMPN